MGSEGVERRGKEKKREGKKMKEDERVQDERKLTGGMSIR